jgi:hypothetical protein
MHNVHKMQGDNNPQLICSKQLTIKNSLETNAAAVHMHNYKYHLKWWKRDFARVQRRTEPCDPDQ